MNPLLRLRGLERGRGLARDQQGVVSREGMALGLGTLEQRAHGPTLGHFVGRESRLVESARLESACDLGMLDLQSRLQSLGHGLGHVGKEQFRTEELNVTLISAWSDLNRAKERSRAGPRVLVQQDESTVSLFGVHRRLASRTPTPTTLPPTVGCPGRCRWRTLHAGQTAVNVPRRSFL
jgi:hypothetical protein